jgi:hypothetical protein
MAIPLENMVGYVRSRVKHGTQNQPKPEVELFIDPNVLIQKTPAGPKVGKPADCCGILYSTADGKLEVRYPDE